MQNKWKLSIACSAFAMLAVPMAAYGQDASASEEEAAEDTGEIIVTGFRGSLNSALNAKRNESAAVDSIVSEELGKFPDSNLAESMQRIPGVTLARGDGGEGRNISVRGLGAGFTRVRINGMEGTAQTGSSDIFGAGNYGRSFDFNVFPSEIFSELSVRKTPSANVEEGSLGATVDLSAPKPLSAKDDFVLSLTAKGIYNELSKKVDPRASLLISKKFADGTFGVLATLAYSNRKIREGGYSAVNILPTYVNGGFCSPIGATVQNPVNNAGNGTDALNCSTGNPRTGSLAVYNQILAATGPSGRPGGGVFLPRIPRYLNSLQDAERIGGTLSLQWQPSDDTEISLDGVYSRFDVNRFDNYIDALSLARNLTNQGQPMVSVRELEVDANGSLVYGRFDGVDLRSESLADRFRTTVAQGALNFSHNFSDTFKVKGLAGYSRSIFHNYERLTVNVDALDTPNFIIDFRNGGSIPTLSYGIDVSNPANFRFAPSVTPVGGNTIVQGNFNTRNRRAVTENQTYELNGEWDVAEGFKLSLGGQHRISDYKAKFLTVPGALQNPRTLPAGTTVASFTRQITGLDQIIPGAFSSFLGVDFDAWRTATGYTDALNCGVECGNDAPEVREEISSGYLMANFESDMLPFPIRGDAGVRFVHTKQSTVGFIPATAPAGSPFPTVGVRAKVDRSYDDWLPSANLVAELTPDLLARFSVAQVLSRPELGSLTPSGSVTQTTRTATLGNPFLDPIRANTIDAALEYYFRPGSLLSVAYFRKDIGTYIQQVSSLIPYNQTGLPDSLLAGTPASPTDLFTVSRVANTPGGKLQGYELNLQMPFDFLPGIFGNFGMLANYTRVKSKIQYVLQSVNGVPTLTTTADLVGLSKNAASGTLYYEDSKFSIRGTANYRGGFIRQIPSGGNDSDVLGNHSTLYVDLAASYAVNDKMKLIFEAQNLTDEHNVLFIDSVRQDPLFDTRIGRTFTFGATVKF